MGLSARQRNGSLLAVDAPRASRTLLPESRKPILLVADHASNLIPPVLNDLGLDAATLNRHVAYDKGTRTLTERLSELLGYSAVLCGYSRLVVDCNRRLSDPTLMPEVSDDVTIPGNQALSESQRSARLNEIYKPYHHAIDVQLKRLEQLHEAPAIVAVHSFTPRLQTGSARPWHVGVLWDKDYRLAGPMLEYLRTFTHLCVGDNEPYSGKHPADYTIDHHGEGARIPCVSIEIRQDLLGTPEGIETWAQRLTTFFRNIEVHTSLFTRRVSSEPGIDGEAS